MMLSKSKVDGVKTPLLSLARLLDPLHENGVSVILKDWSVATFFAVQLGY